MLKTAKFGVKILGGWRMSKTNQPVPTYGKSMLRRNQIAATMIYCNVLLLQLELQYFNSLQQGTPPCGNTAATLSLWPNMTTFHPDPEDAVKPWNCQVKLPGFSEAWNWKQNLWPNWPNKTCWLNGTELSSESALSEAESSTDESAGNFPFGLGFSVAPFFSVFGILFGRKKGALFNPFRSVNPTGKLPKRLEIGKGVVWFQPVSARNSAFFWHPKPWNLTPKFLKSAPDFANREPVGNPSGTSRENPRTAPKGMKKCMFLSHVWAVFGKNPAKSAKNRPNKCQNPAKTTIFVPFGAVHGFSRLVPDWFPTGSRFPKSGVGICRKRCQVLARNLPNWMIS